MILKAKNSKIVGRLPTIFLSGDRHVSEISRIEKSVLGAETIEVVSSPIHGNVYPNNWIDFPNKRQVAGVFGVHNYTMIESTIHKKQWKLFITNYRLDGEKGFEFEYAIPRK